MKTLRHVTEIIRSITFVISEIYMLVIIIQARLISSSNTKNMCSRKQLFNEVRKWNFDHLWLSFKLSRINIVINIDLEVF